MFGCDSLGVHFCKQYASVSRGARECRIPVARGADSRSASPGYNSGQPWISSRWRTICTHARHLNIQQPPRRQWRLLSPIRGRCDMDHSAHASDRDKPVRILCSAGGAPSHAACITGSGLEVKPKARALAMKSMGHMPSESAASLCARLSR